MGTAADVPACLAAAIARTGSIVRLTNGDADIGRRGAKLSPAEELRAAAERVVSDQKLESLRAGLGITVQDLLEEVRLERFREV